MKILWLTHFVLPDLAIALGKAPSPRGGWMPALANELIGQTEIELAIATPMHVNTSKELAINRIRYYVIPCHKKALAGGGLDVRLVDNYKKIIDEFEPDIIHVHGTEYFEGLLTGRKHIACPTVISIQGIIDAYRHHYFGGMSLKSVFGSRTLRDWVRRDGLIEQKMRWNCRAVQEREIFSSNTAFIGRTIWDEAHVHRLSPKARYYHCDELLRPSFFEKKWHIENMRPHSIFASSAGYPIKGFHILIKAVALLRNEFPDISVRTPLAKFYNDTGILSRAIKGLRSTGYARYLSNLIRREGLEKNIISLPSLSEDEMANEFSQANVFVLPSFIENSPNSLAEAMLVGTPAISSYVGGVSSMAKDGQSALFFPAGDETVLAEQLRKLFLDNDLAVRLSKEAQGIASARHDKTKIVADMMRVYRREIAACASDFVK